MLFYRESMHEKIGVGTSAYTGLGLFIKQCLKRKAR